MTPSKKRQDLTCQVEIACGNDLVIEKAIEVNQRVFDYCISDMNDHYKKIAKNRGYIRVYGNPFWELHSDGNGKTYHMGIVHIINKDAEVNKTYEIKNATTTKITNIISKKRHRLIKIEIDRLDNHIYTFTPQRMKFHD